MDNKIMSNQSIKGVQRIKEEIAKLRISKTHAAIEIGCDLSTLSRILNYNQTLTLSFCIKFSNAFGGLPEYWLGVSDWKDKEQKEKELNLKYSALIRYLETIGYKLETVLYFMIYADEYIDLIERISEYTTTTEIEKANKLFVEYKENYAWDNIIPIQIFKLPKWINTNTFSLSNYSKINDDLGDIESYTTVLYHVTHEEKTSIIPPNEIEVFFKHFESISAAFAQSFFETENWNKSL